MGHWGLSIIYGAELLVLRFTSIEPVSKFNLNEKADASDE